MILKNKQSYKSDLNFRIEIDNENIDRVELTKFLGILIDNHLLWNSNTSHTL